MCGHNHLQPYSVSPTPPARHESFDHLFVASRTLALLVTYDLTPPTPTSSPDHRRAIPCCALARATDSSRPADRELPYRPRSSPRVYAPYHPQVRSHARVRRHVWIPRTAVPQQLRPAATAAAAAVLRRAAAARLWSATATGLRSTVSVGEATGVQNGQLTGDRPPQQGYGQQQYSGYQSTPPPQQYGYQQVSSGFVREPGSELTRESHRRSKAMANTASQFPNKALLHTSSARA